MVSSISEKIVRAAILAEPEKYKGQTIPVVGEHIPYSRLGDVISAVTGKTVKCALALRSLSVPLCTLLLNMRSSVCCYPYARASTSTSTSIVSRIEGE